MLQKEANNSHSWWWARHDRTKHSKWLEQNLQEMEEKIAHILKIIENEGDSFVQRVETYYKRRPELINHVEDTYQAYRALAERFDHLSEELQTANRKIASIFPEQVKLAASDDDGPYDKHGNNPMMLNAQSLEAQYIGETMSIVEKLSKTLSSVPTSSGLTKEEALVEIDKVQREILLQQTEKEFLKSVYERCNANIMAIESQISEMQAKISSLQDEFSISNVTDDNEAQIWKAATALKSCQDTVLKLREKQKKSAKEAQAEHLRLKKFHQTLAAINDEHLSDQTDLEEPTEAESENTDQLDMEQLKKKIKEELDVDPTSSLTVTQLAERINELVEKAVKLESEVSSQNAMVSRLRSDRKWLQARIKTLEEEKTTSMESSNSMKMRIKELEEELCRLKGLALIIKQQNNHLQTRIIEAGCKVDSLAVTLETVGREEAKNAELATEVRVAPHVKADSEFEDDEEISMRKERNAEGSYFSESENSRDYEPEELGKEEEYDQPNWKQLFKKGIEKRERLMLDEYSTVLQSYDDVRKKLSDAEKRNQEELFELASQIKELKAAISQRDDEIESLHKQKIRQHNSTTNLTNYRDYPVEGSPVSIMLTPSIPDSNLSSICSPLHIVSAREHDGESRGRFASTVPGSFRKYPAGDIRNEFMVRSGGSRYTVSPVEDKFRSDIDDFLEENLEFWLKFNNLSHQLRKYGNSLHYLKGELLKPKAKRSNGSKSVMYLSSEAQPIYNHLREIHTELTLWLQKASVLRDELHDRYGSLCSTQAKLANVANASSRSQEKELTRHQAAKFQGELFNLKHENNKITTDLQSGLDIATGLKVEVEDILAKLNQELKIKSTKPRSSSRRARLRSFLFGVRLKNKKP